VEECQRSRQHLRLTTAINIELVAFAFIDILKLTEAAPANNDDNDDNELIIIILYISSTVTCCLIVPCTSALTYLLTINVLKRHAVGTKV